jgi:hypothetical protein
MTVVSEELLTDAFEEVLALVSSNDLPLDKISVPKQILSSVTGDVSLEKDVVRHVCRINSTARGEKGDVVALDKDRIATFKAAKLLSASPAPCPLQEFLSKWRAQMPHQCTGYTPPESLLSTLCIREFDAKIGDVRLAYFPAAALPMDHAGRFKRLFGAKGRWPIEEIKPFLAGAVVGGGTVEELLLKHAVVLTEGGKEMVGARPSV